jgi:hypothetical protein
MNNYIPTEREVITLCGSTKFKDQFIEYNRKLTLSGKIVLSVGLFGQTPVDEGKAENTPITDKQKIMLDKIHKQKIDLSDSIFVLNVNGYIGESTRSEIDYAKKTGKKIYYLKKPCSAYKGDGFMCSENTPWNKIPCPACDALGYQPEQQELPNQNTTDTNEIDYDDFQSLPKKDTVCPKCGGLGHREDLPLDPECDYCDNGFIPKPAPEEWVKPQKRNYKTVARVNYSHFCPNCLAMLTELDNYCPGCGKKIDWPSL